MTGKGTGDQPILSEKSFLGVRLVGAGFLKGDGRKKGEGFDKPGACVLIPELHSSGTWKILCKNNCCPPRKVKDSQRGF